MATPTIDRATFDALEETTGAEFVAELIDTFLQEAPAMLTELRRSLAAQDAESFRRVAHSLMARASAGWRVRALTARCAPPVDAAPTRPWGRRGSGAMPTRPRTGDSGSSKRSSA